MEAQSIPETILSDEKESVLEKTNDETEEFDPDQCDMNHYRRKVSWVVLDEEAENKVDKNGRPFYLNLHLSQKYIIIQVIAYFQHFHFSCHILHLKILEYQEIV